MVLRGEADTPTSQVAQQLALLRREGLARVLLTSPPSFTAPEGEAPAPRVAVLRTWTWGTPVPALVHWGPRDQDALLHWFMADPTLTCQW